MKTKLGLLQRDAAEIVVRDISGIEMALIASGVLFWTLLLFAAVRFLVLRWVERGIDQDIHPAVLCTCPSPKCSRHPHAYRNYTNTLSISEFKAVKTNHPCTAPRRVEPPEQARRGGGDTREGA